MGDHLAQLVDHLLTESSTPEATSESRKRLQNGHRLASSGVPIVDFRVTKVVECKICQEEDEVSNMEIPCSCSGSLKHAHRKCVQRWCDEKGDTMCEICLQQFEPGYTAPPPLFHYGSIPMNFRGSWEISSRDLHDSHIITMVPSDRHGGVIGSSGDEYSSFSTSRSCRAVAIIFMTLLVLRHSLPLMLSVDKEYSLTLFSLLVLTTAGILVPLVVIARVLTLFHRRGRQQVGRSIPISGLDDEESVRSRPIHQSQPHLVHSHAPS